MVSQATSAEAEGGGRRLWARYLLPRWRQLVVLGLLLTGSTALQVATPQFLRQFVDGVNRSASVETLVGAAVLFLAFAIGAKALWVASEFVGGLLAWSATNELRADLLEHCLGQDLPFFQKHPPGELIERVDGDVAKLASYFSQMFLLVFVNLLLLLGVGGVLFWQDWRVGLLYLPFVGGSVLLLRRLVGRAVTELSAQREAEAQQLSFMEERLTGLEDLQGIGAGEYTMRELDGHAATLTRRAVRAAKAGIRWPAAAERLSSIGYALGVGAGAWLYLTGRISVGTVFALAAYLAMVRIPLFVITMQFKEMEEALAAQRRIGELFAVHSDVVDGPRAREARAPELELTDLSFSYEPGRPALDGLSLRLLAGEHLAVVGRTGSGKSTLIRLLFRFADPDAGAVRFDGVDIREFTLDSLRSGIALVTQEVQLFHGTVRDNVTLFDENVADGAVVEALTEVGLADWLTRLPAGLDTVLGAGEQGISAGQEQLLAFARVLIADPGLILLDEASSRLDPATQELFMAAMDRVLAGRTAVIVAHRTETLRSVDQVLVLEDGRLAEYGSRDELAHVLRTPEVLA